MSIYLKEYPKVLLTTTTLFIILLMLLLIITVIIIIEAIDQLVSDYPILTAVKHRDQYGKIEQHIH